MRLKGVVRCLILFPALFVMMSCNGQPNIPKQMNLNITTKGNPDTTSKGTSNIWVIVYGVALGVIGLFSMYNAIEIYKKKEVIDKELAEIMMKHKDIEGTIKEHRHKLDYDYKALALEIKEKSLTLEKKLTEFDRSLEDMINRRLAEFAAKYEKEIVEIDTRYSDISTFVSEAIEQFKGFRSTMEQDFNKHLYSYKLYTLIPDYLLDKRNRKDVESACLWFSQWGDDDDLRMLKERRQRISRDDSELLSICDHAIRDLENRMGNMASS